MNIKFLKKNKFNAKKNKLNTKKFKEKNKLQINLYPEKLDIMEKNIIKIEVIAPKNGIEVGGSIYFPFYLKPFEILINGLDKDGKNNSFVKVIRSDGGKIKVENIINNNDFYILNDLKITIIDKKIKENEKIIIIYGTKENKVYLLRKQKKLKIECKIDSKGNGEYKDVSIEKLSVKNGKPKKLFAVLNSFGEKNKENKLIVYVEDENSNICEDYKTNLEIYINSKKYLFDTKKYSNKKLFQNVFIFKIDCEGVYYAKVIDKKNKLETFSNPIIIKEKIDEYIFWGDLHVHSQISDGRGELQDVYRDAYSRGLEFIAVADHSFGRDDRGNLNERIKYQCEVAKEYTLENEFYPVLAGETHYLDINHLNLYFKDREYKSIINIIKNIEKIIPKNINWKEIEEKEKIINKFWEFLSKKENYEKVLAFFHHTMWLGKKEFFDKSMRLIEICSIFGSSELRNQSENSEKIKVMKERLEYGNQNEKISVKELLDEAYELGFIGGSDNHDGQAGKNALTAIFSKKLDYNSIFDAMYNRKTYATNANRTIFDIKINNKRGSEYFSEDNKVEISGMIAGDGKIKKYVFIGNGKKLKEENIDDFYTKIDYKFKSLEKGYYYFKVFLENGDMAWNSPFFIR
ncbi:MAG: hypothetical protein PWP46_535 [Fusobacteriaceae bacterium]|nr:hypothetical protein [Fusobacteriaceae bacterium]